MNARELRLEELSISVYPRSRQISTRLSLKESPIGSAPRSSKSAAAAIWFSRTAKSSGVR